MSLTPNMSKKNHVCRVFIALVNQRSGRTHKAIKAGQSKQWAKAVPQSSPKLQQKSLGAVSLWRNINRKCLSVYQKRVLSPCEVPLQPCPRVTTNWPVLKHAISSTSVSVSFRVHVRTQVSSWQSASSRKRKENGPRRTSIQRNTWTKIASPSFVWRALFLFGNFQQKCLSTINLSVSLADWLNWTKIIRPRWALHPTACFYALMSLWRPGCKLAKLQQITIENRKPVIKLKKEIECHGHFEVVPLQYSAVALQPGRAWPGCWSRICEHGSWRDYKYHNKKGLWRSRSYFHGTYAIAGKVLTNSSAGRKSNWHSNFPIIAHNRRLLMVMNTNIFCSDLMHRKAIKPRCGIMGVPILTLSNFLSSVRDKGTAPFGASPEAFGSPPERARHAHMFVFWMATATKTTSAGCFRLHLLLDPLLPFGMRQSSVLSQLTQ